MPAKPAFTAEELEVIYDAAIRVWESKFAWMKKRTREHPPGQEAMALALGISQQSVSNLIHRKYKPGVTVARNIANLDGKTLETLLPHWGKKAPAATSAPRASSRVTNSTPSAFSNLEDCVRFYRSKRQWSPWTLAAARAGFFGHIDFEAPEWAEHLDNLERTLERVRKGL